MGKFKIYIRTFGCQANVRDSEFITGLFLEKGYKLCDSPDEADIILFNTCSVRGHAEERAINNMALLMNRHKDRIYGMIGCMAQGLGKKLFERLSKLNIVCGTGEIANLPELVEKAVHNKSSGGLNLHYSACGRILAINDVNSPLPESNPSYRESDKQAYVFIMRGCNNFCSYCIVPHVRGRERSRKVSDIINELKDLAGRGIRDITLLGQNVNSYKGLTCNFAQLLRRINQIDGIEKISFMTSHPKDATIELFRAIRDLDKVIKQLHLPLQSGSDRILKLMNRGYTVRKYTGLVRKLRALVTGCRITTDMIVGFPGETDTDFRKTYNIMNDIKFNAAYIFKYSPRPGTEAFKLKDDVPQEVKKERHRILLDLQKGLRRGLLAMALIASLLIAAPSAQAKEISKASFIKGINISFLKEDYTGLVKNAKKNLNYLRLNRREKKEVLHLTGLSYIKLGSFTEAREMFNKILRMKGNKFRQDAYIGIADSYFYGKNFKKAISAYEGILRAYPGSERLSSVYYNLGLIFKAKRDLDKANYYFLKIKKRYNTSFEADKITYLPIEKKADHYVIQLGAFKSLKNARKLQRKLARKRYDSYIQKAKDRNILYKVRGGKFSNKYYAKRLVRKLRRDGFPAKMIME